jgi:hypothetical protein
MDTAPSPHDTGEHDVVDEAIELMHRIADAASDSEPRPDRVR